MKQKFFAAIMGLCFSFTALAANPMVEMKTNQGSITLELYADQAPKTVANFLSYVKTGYYQGVIFHRVIEGFMIQGGGFDTQLREKETAAQIQNEATNGLKNETYTIAMARTSAPFIPARAAAAASQCIYRVSMRRTVVGPAARSVCVPTAGPTTQVYSLYAAPPAGTLNGLTQAE